MSEKTDEQLAVALEQIADDVESVFSGDQSDDLREAAARLRQQSEDSARLDWLESQTQVNTDPPEFSRVSDGSFSVGDQHHEWHYGATLRAAIDKARKGNCNG